VIKKNILKELGEDIYVQALAIFLRNAEKDFALLNLYIETKDFFNAKQICHKLIGSCEAIGVKKLPVVLRVTDDNLKLRYVKAENLCEVNQLFEELKDYIHSNFELEIDG